MYAICRMVPNSVFAMDSKSRSKETCWLWNWNIPCWRYLNWLEILTDLLFFLNFAYCFQELLFFWAQESTNIKTKFKNFAAQTLNQSKMPWKHWDLIWEKQRTKFWLSWFSSSFHATWSPLNQNQNNNEISCFNNSKCLNK